MGGHRAGQAVTGERGLRVDMCIINHLKFGPVISLFVIVIC